MRDTALFPVAACRRGGGSRRVQGNILKQERGEPRGRTWEEKKETDTRETQGSEVRVKVTSAPLPPRAETSSKKLRLIRSIKSRRCRFIVRASSSSTERNWLVATPAYPEVSIIVALWAQIPREWESKLIKLLLWFAQIISNGLTTN